MTRPGVFYYSTVTTLTMTFIDLPSNGSENTTWLVATPQESEEIAQFVVNCLREAFTKNFILGPQEIFKSKEFEQAYQVYRHKMISNPLNICRILRDASTKEILGYAELGPKKDFVGKDHIDFEIICLFCHPSMKGKGIGTFMISFLFKEMANLGRLIAGQHTVGVMTLSGSPFKRFYLKIGAKKESEHELIWVRSPPFFSR